MPYRNPDSSSCTAVGSSGKFCNGESLPDAPFPICLTHAADVLRYLRSYMPQTLAGIGMAAAEGIEQQRHRDAERRARKPRTDVVYYVQVGKHIKIGTTTSLASRMRSYPPDSRLLAYEPGDGELERQRHREFTTDLAMGREWFLPSDALLAHIKDVRSAHVGQAA